MLKYVDTLITFSEIPNEISLCINLSGCPHRCKGCHSPYLWNDMGEPLEFHVLDTLIRNNQGISNVCFMGGDNDIPRVLDLVDRVKKVHHLNTAVYSGNDLLPSVYETNNNLDYIKIGRYIEELGPLTSEYTNQKMYKRVDGKLIDITSEFWKKPMEG